MRVGHERLMIVCRKCGVLRYWWVNDEIPVVNDDPQSADVRHVDGKMLMPNSHFTPCASCGSLGLSRTHCRIPPGYRLVNEDV